MTPTRSYHEAAMPGDKDQSTATLAWTNLPLKGRRGTVIFLAVLLPVLAALVYHESHNAFAALLAVAFVAVVITPAVLPTTYTLDAEGVTVRHIGKTVSHPWSACKRLIVDVDVIVLSPFPKASFLDSFRGVYLRFNRGQETIREEAMQFALARMPRCHGTARET